MFLATAPRQPLPALILDTATELCQEKPGYLGDHSQTALAELTRCILPKFFSLSYTVSQFLCAWAKHKDTKEKNHQISSYFNHSPSITRISTWSKGENNCVQILLHRWVLMPWCDRRLLYAQGVFFVCLLSLGIVQTTSKYHTKIIHLSRLCPHQMLKM